MHAMWISNLIQKKNKASIVIWSSLKKKWEIIVKKIECFKNIKIAFKLKFNV